MGLELSHSRDHLGSVVPRVLLEQAIYEVIDHRSLTMTPTFIPEKYDSVVSPLYAQEQESEGEEYLSIAVAIHKIPRLSPKQPASFFLSGLIPLGNSPGS